MRDSIPIGSSPVEEDCAQVGSDDYSSRARKECRRFIELIRRTLGPEPEGARLFVKANQHDYGVYYEVECEFDDEIPESVKYAFMVEEKAPKKWDAEVVQSTP